MDTDNMKILTADEIWAAKDIEERTVPVPQWGGAVRIRTLSQKQSAELRRKAQRINPATKQSELDNEALEQLLFIEGVVEQVPDGLLAQLKPEGRLVALIAAAGRPAVAHLFARSGKGIASRAVFDAKLPPLASKRDDSFVF